MNTIQNQLKKLYDYGNILTPQNWSKAVDLMFKNLKDDKYNIFKKALFNDNVIETDYKSLKSKYDNKTIEINQIYTFSYSDIIYLRDFEDYDNYQLDCKIKQGDISRVLLYINENYEIISVIASALSITLGLCLLTPCNYTFDAKQVHLELNETYPIKCSLKPVSSLPFDKIIFLEDWIKSVDNDNVDIHNLYYEYIYDLEEMPSDHKGWIYNTPIKYVYVYDIIKNKLYRNGNGITIVNPDYYQFIDDTTGWVSNIDYGYFKHSYSVNSQIKNNNNIQTIFFNGNVDLDIDKYESIYINFYSDGSEMLDETYMCYCDIKHSRLNVSSATSDNISNGVFNLYLNNTIYNYDESYVNLKIDNLVIDSFIYGSEVSFISDSSYLMKPCFEFVGHPVDSDTGQLILWLFTFADNSNISVEF